MPGSHAAAKNSTHAQRHAYRHTTAYSMRLGASGLNTQRPLVYPNTLEPTDCTSTASTSAQRLGESPIASQ
eukprot:5087945-Pleurochrysis_carterae.AAC.1